MVVQMTLNKIEELKERPHHERKTIALYGAIIVAAFFLFVWGYFALRNIGNTAVALTNAQNSMHLSTQTAAAASISQDQLVITPPELTASSTNGRVELVPKSMMLNQN